VFLVSDFLTERFDNPLRIASKKHDTVAINISDIYESQLPDVGMMQIYDAESGNISLIDTSSKSVRENYKQWWESHQKSLETVCSKSNVDLIQIRTDQSYIVPLQNFFKKRERRR
jgi:uncharacterized protein (DUF58 family)